MASQTTKIFAIVALVALSAIAASAATCPQSFPSMMGMGMMSPCMQSCMMQHAFTMASSPLSAMTMGMMSPQCQCSAMCQMMMQQQAMIMPTMMTPYMCNMLPTYY
uniref:Putative storage protein n=1 Tax=Eragrostis tef TaxID=110835 RepID=A0A173G7S0_ERATE|nr:putative storage protein [Eragrostis tef]